MSIQFNSKTEGVPVPDQDLTYKGKNWLVFAGTAAVTFTVFPTGSRQTNVTEAALALVVIKIPLFIGLFVLAANTFALLKWIILFLLNVNI